LLHEYVANLPGNHVTALRRTSDKVEKLESIQDLQAWLGRWAYAKKMATRKRN
jgi:hypothetical protein